MTNKCHFATQICHIVVASTAIPLCCYNELPCASVSEWKLADDGLLKACPTVSRDQRTRCSAKYNACNPYGRLHRMDSPLPILVLITESRPRQVQVFSLHNRSKRSGATPQVTIVFDSKSDISRLCYSSVSQLNFTCSSTRGVRFTAPLP